MKVKSQHQKIVTDPDGLKFKVRDIEDFEEDWFGWPEEQPFPDNHYEFKSWGSVGAIGSGKSTMSEDYCGGKLADRWSTDNVDFFKARDIWGIVEGIKKSTKQVHYVIIDDASPIFNSRRAMTDNNVTITDFYFEIRHRLEDAANEANGNVGGLVFFNIVVQNYMAIDNRLRDALGFIVFKTYDKYLDKQKVNFEIKRALKKMTYQSIVCCRYFYRKMAVAVDCEDKYTLIYSEKAFEPIQFITVTGEDLSKTQFNKLIDFLINNVNLNEKKWYIRGKLLLEFNNMKKTERFVRVDKSDFDDIIILAKTIKKDTEDDDDDPNISKERENELLEELEKERKNGQIIYVRDTKLLTFQAGGATQGLSEAQFFKRYTKAVEVQERRFNEHKNKSEVQTTSIREFALNLLIEHVGINKIIQAKKEDLHEYLKIYVPSQLHLGEIETLADCVNELIQERYIKGIGKELFQELVVKPVNEILKEK